MQNSAERSSPLPTYPTSYCVSCNSPFAPSIPPPAVLTPAPKTGKQARQNAHSKSSWAPLSSSGESPRDVEGRLACSRYIAITMYHDHYRDCCSLCCRRFGLLLFFLGVSFTHCSVLTPFPLFPPGRRPPKRSTSRAPLMTGPSLSSSTRSAMPLKRTLSWPTPRRRSFTRCVSVFPWFCVFVILCFRIPSCFLPSSPSAVCLNSLEGWRPSRASSLVDREG